MTTVTDQPYRVHVVVDPHYAERIRNLPMGEPTWVVDSAENHPVIQALWREQKRLDEFTGITSFKYDPDTRPESWLIALLSIIDLHHYYHDPPYSVLNIIGTPWSETIQKELERFGFCEHEPTAYGFITKRDLTYAEPPFKEPQEP